MRYLTDYELDLIAGGTTSSGPDVTVYGYRLWEDSSWFEYEIGGGGSGPSEEPVEEPNETPCVETSFSTPGVTTQDANRAALAASNSIKSSPSYGNWEYSSIIFLHNGSVGYTYPYTDQSYNGVNLLGSLDSVPDGAVILGVIHSHPDDPLIDDRIPSGGSSGGKDWTGYDAIVGAGSLERGISVDANMLLYILTDQDDSTRVYDKTDKSQTNPACSL